MIFTNGTYDKLRLVALVFAPISVFIIAVCSAFHVPGMETITAVLAAVETLLGSLVEISRQAYNKGSEAQG